MNDDAGARKAVGREAAGDELAREAHAGTSGDADMHQVESLLGAAELDYNAFGAQGQHLSGEWRHVHLDAARRLVAPSRACPVDNMATEV